MASAIVMAYVRLIRAGVKTIEDVPERIREDVRMVIEGDAYVPPEQEQEPQPDSEPESEQEPETQEDGEDEGVDGADSESDA